MGNKGTMPWGDKPLDGAYFKKRTEGHTVVMGRKTFDSMGRKPLPNRRSIVLSKSPIWDFDVGVANNVKSVVSRAKEYEGVMDVWIIGGSEVFNQFMPYIEEMHVTTVGDSFEGDVFFPDIHEGYKWTSVLVKMDVGTAQNGEKYNLVFRKFTKQLDIEIEELTVMKNDKEKTTQGGQSCAQS